MPSDLAGVFAGNVSAKDHSSKLPIILLKNSPGEAILTPIFTATSLVK
jgi:hypothetical protein